MDTIIHQGKIQTIICRCGKTFAACCEPHCYTDNEWLKDLKKYVNEGCSVIMIEHENVKLERCICEPKLF